MPYRYKKCPIAIINVSCMQCIQNNRLSRIRFCFQPNSIMYAEWPSANKINHLHLSAAKFLLNTVENFQKQRDEFIGKKNIEVRRQIFVKFKLFMFFCRFDKLKSIGMLRIRNDSGRILVISLKINK